MSSEQHIHIVCLDVPYPPNYGGVFDLFYKLKYLHEQGVIIHLHCFEYGRGKQDELLQVCATVQYYKRSGGWLNLLRGFPYMVGSRSHPGLFRNLSADRYPILLEGIHCTYPLRKNLWKDRKVILRLHNIEFEYYRQLADHATLLLRKCYYRLESFLLRRYERRVAPQADLIIAVTETDTLRYQQLNGSTSIRHLPVFTPWNQVTCRPGRGSYCLYQGNLSVSENERAAIWLIKKVFASSAFPFVIAGKNPSRSLKKEVERHRHISIIENPTEEKMQQLIEAAHINLLPSFSTTGIKLKLLHALFCGRHCISNANMLEGTDLSEACILAENESEVKSAVQNLYEQPFTAEMVLKRQTLLTRHFNNRLHAKQLADWIAEQDLSAAGK